MYKVIFTFVFCILSVSPAFSAAEMRPLEAKQLLEKFLNDYKLYQKGYYGLYVPNINVPGAFVPQIKAPGSLVSPPIEIRPSCINELCSALTEKQCSVKPICKKTGDN